MQDFLRERERDGHNKDFTEGVFVQDRFVHNSDSPKDACRSSAVCSALKDSADSDEAWEGFLPSDWQHLVAQSSSPNLNSLPKKQLYLHLCDHPLLLADNTLV